MQQCRAECVAVVLPDDEPALMKRRQQAVNHGSVQPEVASELGGGARLALADPQEDGKGLVGGLGYLGHRYGGCSVNSGVEAVAVVRIRFWSAPFACG